MVNIVHIRAKQQSFLKKLKMQLREVAYNLKKNCNPNYTNILVVACTQQFELNRTYILATKITYKFY